MRSFVSVTLLGAANAVYLGAPSGAVYADPWSGYGSPYITPALTGYDWPSYVSLPRHFADARSYPLIGETSLQLAQAHAAPYYPSRYAKDSTYKDI